MGMTREKKEKLIQHLKYSMEIGADYLITDEDTVEIIKALEQEPKIGHWIYEDECKEHGYCSRCGYGGVDLVDGELHNYCPNCGARMIEPQERSGKEC